ncbi:methyltransferase domain-containing protein [Streptomyces sp. B-S-A8]|uniref:Methyltransferase domain-containing protein n=1 Tax=Streptomyces solicavernae TaxID=3043614 RepID=A0ABT6RSF1_9ACTN|nr:methyltransferase domain-containing protein [Streptomyces sp. B-S-A8]MDI3387358.1 methyltransferase domain-containing protein [Streptomyces sp. B-S-A8]
MTQTRTHGYLLDPRPAEAGRPFDATAALFDASTFRHFEHIGVGPGWRCWEVGAGGGSVLGWLAKRVGPTGRVVGTDLDIAHASAVARPPVEVRCHDVTAQEPPGEGFDLVHARLVLSQVTDRDRALYFMVRALRPGGRLLVEDADVALQPLGCPEEQGPAQQLANHVRHGLRALLAERGADPAYGRRLPRLLREAGLVQVAAEAYFPLTSPAAAALETATVQQARDLLVARSLVTNADIDRYLAQLSSGTLDLATPPLISAWGRKA